MAKTTCLTLSLEASFRETPKDCLYYNYNSKFSDEIGVLNAYKESVKNIDTENIFICDDDDPMLDEIPEFTDALIYGDFYYNDIRVNKPIVNHIVKSNVWERKLHLNRWYLIHKPIMKTKYFKEALNHIEENELMHVQHAVHYLIAMTYGSLYIPTFRVVWNKHETGLHNEKTLEKITYTRERLLNNRDRIYTKLIKNK